MKTYTVKGRRCPYKSVLDVFSKVEGVRISRLVGQEEEDHDEEEIHKTFFKYGFHLHFVESGLAGFL